MISKLSYIGTSYLHNSGAHLVDDGVHGDLGRFDDWLGENGEVGVACTEGGSSSGIEVESGRGACDMNGGDGDEYVELSTEELVEEAMRRVDFGGEVEFELMPGEMKEDLFVGQFMERGCGCVRKGGRACCEQFDVEHVKDVRLSFRALSSSEMDMALMGQLMAFSNTNSFTSSFHKTPHERSRSHTVYYHQGKSICNVMFRFLHGISKNKLYNITRSLIENGLTPRVHGNTKRLPVHTITLKSVEYVVRFLLNFAEQHALLLPGYSRDDIKLLPSSTTKRAIWKVYKEAAAVEDSIQTIAYSTFCHLWRKQLPSIRLMKPMTDLCWTCQQNSSAILKAANCPERQKSSVVEAAQEHLRIVQIERSFYKTTCDDCKKSIREFFTNSNDFQPPPLASQSPANSRDIKAHYSFDYAQQVHFPSDPLQPGPIYFLTPRKCSVFGVNCEALPRQVNFLCDEAGDCGKGANTVISQLDFFFNHHGLGEKEVFLHADNCSGQNKNNFMLWYLAWRAMTGRHTQITLSFLVVGHTKFSPDWCFGLFKRLYRRTKLGSLQAIAQVVNNSAQCNFAQLVCTEDGTTVVPVFDWSSFFATRFRKLPGIKKIHHLRFPSSDPGVVYVKTHSDEEEVKFNLLKKSSQMSPDPSEYPERVQPKGLSAERQWYLFDQIREFCPEGDRDVTCPRPSVPKPGSRAGTPVAEGTNEEEVVASPPAKKSRRCGTCREEGHNSRSCPNKEH